MRHEMFSFSNFSLCYSCSSLFVHLPRPAFTILHIIILIQPPAVELYIIKLNKATTNSPQRLSFFVTLSCWWQGSLLKTFFISCLQIPFHGFRFLSLVGWTVINLMSRNLLRYLTIYNFRLLRWQCGICLAQNSTKKNSYLREFRFGMVGSD